MNQSTEIGALAAALAAAQSRMQHAEKDGSNPHYKSSYATLATVIDAIRPHFSANGLAYSQEPRTERATVETIVGKNESQRLVAVEGMIVTVTTRIMHSSGEWLASECSAVVPSTLPQPIGSAISYLRRYALQSIAGLASADDDGEATRQIATPQERKANLTELRKELARLEFDVEMVEEFCASLGRPFDSLTQSAGERLIYALGSEGNFYLDYVKWLDKKRKEGV